MILILDLNAMDLTASRLLLSLHTITGTRLRQLPLIKAQAICDLYTQLTPKQPVFMAHLMTATSVIFLIDQVSVITAISISIVKKWSLDMIKYIERMTLILFTN